MENLTVNKIAPPKTINFQNKKTGKPDSFQKVGFLSNEYPDRWFDIAFRGECPIVTGGTYEFEITSREYNGKTYYDAKLPQKRSAGTGDLNRVEVKMDAHYNALMTELQMIRGLLNEDPLESEF